MLPLNFHPPREWEPLVCFGHGRPWSASRPSQSAGAYRLAGHQTVRTARGPRSPVAIVRAPRRPSRARSAVLTPDFSDSVHCGLLLCPLSGEDPWWSWVSAPHPSNQ